MSVTFVTFSVLFVMYIFCHITVLMRSCSQQVCVCVCVQMQILQVCICDCNNLFMGTKDFIGDKKS